MVIKKIFKTPSFSSKIVKIKYIINLWRGRLLHYALRAFFSSSVKIIILAILVLAAGCYCQYAGYDKFALSRAGCLLVIISVIAVGLNHFLQSEIQMTTAMLKDTEVFKDIAQKVESLLSNGEAGTNSEPSEEFISALDRMAATLQRRVHSDISQERAREMIITMAYQRISLKKLLPEYKNRFISVVAAEFMLAITGTFFWGFGDVLI